MWRPADNKVCCVQGTMVTAGITSLRKEHSVHSSDNEVCCVKGTMVTNGYASAIETGTEYTDKRN